MPHNWKDFSSYKENPNRDLYYSEVAPEIIRESALNSKNTGDNVQEKLKLMTAEAVYAHPIVKWPLEGQTQYLSEFCADFAAECGSHKPTFDAMLMIKRMLDLVSTSSLPFHPDNPEGWKIQIKDGNLLMTNPHGANFGPQPLVEELALDKNYESSLDLTRQETNEELFELELYLENLSEGKVNEIVAQSYESVTVHDEFPSGILILEEAFKRGQISLDEFYLALITNGTENEGDNFDLYLENYIQGVDRVIGYPQGYPQFNALDFDNLAGFKQRLKVILEERVLSASEVSNVFVADNLNKIHEAADGLYEFLELDPLAIKRPSEVFLEMAFRREIGENDYIDEVQTIFVQHPEAVRAAIACSIPLTSNIISLYPPLMLMRTAFPPVNVAYGAGTALATIITTKMMEKKRAESSIGPLEIRPTTHLQAMLVESGQDLELVQHNDYQTNLTLAKKTNVIQKEEDVWSPLLNPHQAINAYVRVLSMYMPKPDEKLYIILTRTDASGDGDKKNKYYLPIQDSYIFNSSSGQVEFSYDEMRLMQAVARYQGGGLMLSGKGTDAQVQVNGNEINTNSITKLRIVDRVVDTVV